MLCVGWSCRAKGGQTFGEKDQPGDDDSNDAFGRADCLNPVLDGWRERLRQCDDHN